MPYVIRDIPFGAEYSTLLTLCLNVCFHAVLGLVREMAKQWATAVSHLRGNCRLFNKDTFIMVFQTVILEH